MKRIVILCFALLTLSFSSLWASGVDLTVYYGSRYIYLGGQQIAIATDGYSPFYNPAGMAFAKNNELTLNSSNLMYQFEAPIGADNAQRKSKFDIAPLFYGSGIYSVNDFITLGFAVFPTSLQGSEFTNVDYGAPVVDKKWGVRLVRIEFAPTISFRFNDHIAVGFSYRPAYSQSDLKFGTFGTPLQASYIDSSTSGWDAKGMKFGLHIHDVANWSFGATYRPAVDLDLDGEAKLTTALGTTTHDATQEFTIPAQLQLGAAYQWNPSWLSTFSYEFTQNSAAVTNGLSIPDLIALGQTTETSLRWKDGHALHFGTEYTKKLGADRFWRAGLGLAYDRAVTRKGKPIPGLAPSNDYIGYCVGGQYNTGMHTTGLAFNVGQYEHSTNSIDADMNPLSIYKGNYGLIIYTLSADYQFRF